jgi:hypothetical protein
LIDELTQLWSFEVLTYDVLMKNNSLMKAALMLIINDFPAYGIISGWSMNRKLACPYYIENNKAFTLINDSKMSFFFIVTNGSCQWITTT